VSELSSGSAFVRGARLFDAGAFFEAHEAWEDRWRITTDETERRFLQGLIQVAAALHKLLVMGSPEAASRLFARALAKLDACPADLTREEGFDLTAFRRAIHACADALAGGRFDRTAVPLMLGDAAERP
jgi:predicted metal-dependent hydrolase